jgi:hypothetical protein
MLRYFLTSIVSSVVGCSSVVGGDQNKAVQGNAQAWFCSCCQLHLPEGMLVASSTSGQLGVQMCH